MRWWLLLLELSGYLQMLPHCKMEHLVRDCREPDCPTDTEAMVAEVVMVEHADQGNQVMNSRLRKGRAGNQRKYRNKNNVYYC